MSIDVISRPGLLAEWLEDRLMDNSARVVRDLEAENIRLHTEHLAVREVLQEARDVLVTTYEAYVAADQRNKKLLTDVAHLEKAYEKKRAEAERITDLITKSLVPHAPEHVTESNNRLAWRAGYRKALSVLEDNLDEPCQCPRGSSYHALNCPTSPGASQKFVPISMVGP